MKNLHWEDSKGALDESLGITKERFNEINFLNKTAIHNLRTPVRDKESNFTAANIVKAFLDIAETTEEVALQGYLARKTIELYSAKNLLPDFLKSILKN